MISLFFFPFWQRLLLILWILEGLRASLAPLKALSFDPRPSLDFFDPISPSNNNVVVV